MIVYSFTVLCFYLNWALTEQIYVDENLKLFEKTKSDVHHLIDNKIYDTADHIKQARNMEEASKKIKHLEGKIKQLESRIPKQFPDVKFLNYRERKRILVST